MPHFPPLCQLQPFTGEFPCLSLPARYNPAPLLGSTEHGSLRVLIMGESWEIECDNCGQTIRMARMPDGKCIAYELERGGRHYCGRNSSASQQGEITNSEPVHSPAIRRASELPPAPSPATRTVSRPAAARRGNIGCLALLILAVALVAYLVHQLWG